MKIYNFNTMIDENLYSRQIAVYGKNEMKSMISSKVKVIGINGSSLELCKNLILSGIGKLCIKEERKLKNEDLSTIYFAKYEDKPLGQKKSEVGRAVPFGRMGVAEDLTGMAVFLASDEAAYIVAQTYNVDGGSWMS